MSLTIRIIRPAGREKDNLLPRGIADLEALGHCVRFDDTTPSTGWKYAAASIPDRAHQLRAALLEKDSDLVLCARGGYGASDLLPLMDWQELAQAPEKIVVGFSDISALHCALYGTLRWKGIHGPMPATTLWGKNTRTDLSTLFDILAGGTGPYVLPLLGDLPLTSIEGWLFGGCFSVLTNLIGTPYFPPSLAGSILILEDVAEHPARLMRYWNQWIQAGVLKGVQALVLGAFSDLGDGIQDSEPSVLQEFSKRSGLPTFHSPVVGHVSPNMPFQIGAKGKIGENGTLSWIVV